jgi:signal peptidase I
MVYALLAVYAVLLLTAGLITALKGKWATLVVGLVSFAWLFGAVRLARPDSFWDRRFHDEDQRRRARRLAPRRRKLAVVGLTASVLMLVAVFGALKAYRIPAANMEPTLHCAKPNPGCRGDTSDRVIALRFLFGRDPARGDIVTYRMPAKGADRCGSVEGATHIARVQSLDGDSMRVRGDFPEQSCDSSVWGSLPRDRLVAKVVFRYWPLDRLGTP